MPGEDIIIPYKRCGVSIGFSCRDGTFLTDASSWQQGRAGIIPCKWCGVSIGFSCRDGTSQTDEWTTRVLIIMCYQWYRTAAFHSGTLSRWCPHGGSSSRTLLLSRHTGGTRTAALFVYTYLVTRAWSASVSVGKRVGLAAVRSPPCLLAMVWTLLRPGGLQRLGRVLSPQCHIGPGPSKRGFKSCA